MRLVKIGVAAVSVKVGDFKGNAERLCAVIDRARDEGVHLLATPELCVSGYSLEDRIWWPEITRHSWDSLQSIAEHCDGISVFLGLPIRMNSLMYNAAALVHDGKTRGLILKKYLPTYSIFYEGRNWAAWGNGATEYRGVPAGDLVFDLPYGKVSAEVCEDLWAPERPAYGRVRAGAEIICNISASPFTPRKNESRKRLVHGAALGMNCIYAFANVLGLDNCRLVFDGGGIIAKPERIVAEGAILSKEPWTLTTATVDLDEIARQRAENSSWRSSVSSARDQECTPAMIDVQGTYTPAPLKDYVAQMPASFFEAGAAEADPKPEADCFLDELFDGLALGVRDYFEKVGAFDRFLVALSGGRDSALALLVAVEAVKAMRGGKDADLAARIHTAYLPNKAYSSAATENAARSLAEELGVAYQVVSISEETEVALAKAAELVGGVEHVTSLARQNLQARVRGAMMLNWANNTNALLLVTSNLSEAAVGYTTTGGDNQGGYSPIANLPKTLVTRLLAYLAERDGLHSLASVLEIPPSAELEPDQEDEADLMPYAILDDLLYLFARRRMALLDCWRVLCHRHATNDAEELRAWTAKFGRLFVQSQWKRDQLPASLKVLDLDLDPKTGFRFPVTQSIQNELDELAEAELE